MGYAWDELITGLRKGSIRALSRMISGVENRAPGWMDAMKMIYPHTGKARLIGITGPPGAGKSTLTNGITKELIAGGKGVGIIAVDPSSPYSGGSLLGDRLRMKDVWDLDEVYIRSMATRGALGGLNQSARDVAKIMDAFGMDFVLVETVGVGQDEIEVVKNTDLVIMVCVPGQGDSIQALKAGVMEIADIFVINKVDRDGADILEMDIQAMLDLKKEFSQASPPVLKTVANKGDGIAILVKCISDMLSSQTIRSDWHRARVKEELIGLVEKQLIDILQSLWEKDGILEISIDDILSGRDNPYASAERFLSPLQSKIESIQLEKFKESKQHHPPFPKHSNEQEG